jgi:hypothetical protein
VAIPDVTQAIDAFTQHARRFCALVDATPPLTGFLFLSALAPCLADLYGAACRLPVVSPATPTLDDVGTRTTEWKVIVSALHARLPFDTYWEIFNPLTVEGEEPMACSLADDLAGIYLDLQEGLRLLQRQAAPADVVWTWQFGFMSHWGRHLVEALGAIHHFLVETT